MNLNLAAAWRVHDVRRRKSDVALTLVSSAFCGSLSPLITHVSASCCAALSHECFTSTSPLTYYMGSQCMSFDCLLAALQEQAASCAARPH